MMKKILFALLCCVVSPAVFGQDNSSSLPPTTYTLSQVVEMARQKSIQALQAKNRRENSYWVYRRFRANYVPQLMLSGTIPQYTRSIDPITQPDGTQAFVSRQLSTSLSGLYLEQGVAATGTRISVGSQLQRIDLFGNQRTTTFATNPLQMRIEQPFFVFNPLKWDRKIQPLYFEGSLRQYNEDIENAALQSSNLFFDLLLAQISLEIAQKNQANNDTIFRIGQGRYQLGKIAENDLLQLELNLINAQQQVKRARLDLETRTLSLNIFIGNQDHGKIALVEPNEIPTLLIPTEVALDQARANRPVFIAFQRRRIEAERDVAKAKADNGLDIFLNASFGLTQTSADFNQSYANPRDQQGVSVTFSIPVLDWGRRQANIKSAQANQELINNTVQLEEINFEQQVLTLVKQFELLQSQLVSAIRADQIAQKKYDIAQNRYLVNKINVTDLNIALQEKDSAKRSYLQAMREYWNAYYQLRVLTLFDFEKNQPIKY